MKIKRTKILLIIMGILGCILSVLFICLRQSSSLYVNGLTYDENKEYAEFYGLEYDGYFSGLGIKDYFAFKPTKKTIELCDSLNYFIFPEYECLKQTSTNYQSSWYSNVGFDWKILSDEDTDLMSDKELSAEASEFLPLPNGFTIDWILNNPRKAYSFIQEAKNKDSQFLPPLLLERIFIEKKEGLTLREYMHYLIYYDIEVNRNNGIMYIYENGYDDLDGNSLRYSVNTETTVKLLNLYLWTDEEHIKEQYPNLYKNTKPYNEWNDVINEARKTAETHGFSKTHPITVEWIVDYPNQAYHLACDFTYDFSNRCILYSALENSNNLGEKKEDQDIEDVESAEPPFAPAEYKITSELGKVYKDIDYYYFASSNIATMTGAGSPQKWKVIQIDSLIGNN